MQNKRKYGIIIKLLKRPHGQAVKTPPSHGGNWGSIPHGATKKKGQVFYLSFLFGIFLRELSRRAPRGCSRERSDALPRGPLRGFGRFPPRLSPSRTGFLPVLSFWYFSPGIEQARTARLFARAERRSAEGAPPGFRQIPSPPLSLTDRFFTCPFFLVFFSRN